MQGDYIKYWLQGVQIDKGKVFGTYLDDFFTTVFFKLSNRGTTMAPGVLDLLESQAGSFGGACEVLDGIGWLGAGAAPSANGSAAPD